MRSGLTRRQFVGQGGAAIIGLSVLGTSLLPGCRPDSHGTSSNRASVGSSAELEKLIPGLMERAAVPGAAVAMVRNGEAVWQRGFGISNAESREPIVADTVFEAASLSKPVFAYAVLKMVERGELDLDKPLVDYMAQPYLPIPGLMADPEIPDDPRLKRITPRIVLSHRTGFPNWSGGKPLSLNFGPGEKFGYSGEGYVYLQRVVEHLSGQPLDEYMQQNVLDPLGMRDSSYVWTGAYETRAATGHGRRSQPGGGWKARRAVAAGSLYTTAGDYAKLLLAMLEPRRDDPFRLSRETLSRMLTPQIEIDGSLSWGLGWGLERIAEGTAFWHWGDDEVFKNFTLTSVERKTGVIILTNSQNGLQICEDIVRLTVGGEHPAFSFSMLDY